MSLIPAADSQHLSLSLAQRRALRKRARCKIPPRCQLNLFKPHAKVWRVILNAVKLMSTFDQLTCFDKFKFQLSFIILTINYRGGFVLRLSFAPSAFQNISIEHSLALLLYICSFEKTRSFLKLFVFSN